MKFIFFLSLLSISLFGFAQSPSGCIIYPYNFGGYGGLYSGKVYQTRLSGVSVPPGAAADIQQGQPVYNGGSAGETGTSVNMSCYIQPNNMAGRDCAVRVTISANTYDWLGGIYAEQHYSCPLDEHLPFILILSGILGFFIIRKKAKFLDKPRNY
jgi:hypothetical protein